MNNFGLGILSIYYLGLLFIVAYWAESSANKNKSLVNNPYVYSLSLAVYCTAWTFFGSVGRAVSNGLEYLTVYIGPTLMMPLWWLVMRKIIRISKLQRITNIADFISSRYGKNRTLGVMVTVFCLLACVPYISLQLKAISNSFSIITGTSTKGFIGILNDNTFYVALILILFTILFGTRKVEATERHEGLVFAIAVESGIKLVAFLMVGIYITYFVFDGFEDVFGKTALKAETLSRITKISNESDWFWHVFASMMAIMFLPRQFQVAVIENYDEKHLNRAMWLFPLYMLLINIFVIPIALGGELIFTNNQVSPDNYVLAIPQHFKNEHLVNFTYIGGFSAATSMIVVETIAISLMVSNNLIMPLILSSQKLKNNFSQNPTVYVQAIRRVSIFLIIFLGYLYFKFVSQKFSLVSLGLVSFVAVSQFAPSIIGGIYWKRGNQMGAKVGLAIGFFIWFFTLILPSMISAGYLPKSIVESGLGGIEFLNPFHLFGMTGLDEISHALFWSLSLNIIFYGLVSIFTEQNSIEHNQAVLFVDVFNYSETQQNSTVWKGKALITDIKSLLISFLGETRTEKIVRTFAQKNNINLKNQYADPRLVTYSEKLLAGIVGTASARIMVSSVAKEEKISLEEVVEILKKSQELLALNKELQRKSDEMKVLTEQLQRNDRLKDDFLSTVTHEIRTPLTSIKALSEILFDNPDLEIEERQHFLNTIVKESDRLSRLINQVLDLEKFDSGKLKLNTELIDVVEIIKESIESIEQLAKEKKIELIFISENVVPKIQGDFDRIMQVVLNLLSNAIKFTEAGKGDVTIQTFQEDNQIIVSVQDNGQGVSEEFRNLIFEKFYQADNQMIRKPKGSGLGLAISKKIIELHNGKIWVEGNANGGSNFIFTLPI
ncbi:MAG: ATP-binding protein [Spirosomataceae bacterium]